MSEIKRDFKILCAFVCFALLCVSLQMSQVLLTNAEYYGLNVGFASGNLSYACVQGENGDNECSGYIKPMAAKWNGLTPKASLTYNDSQDSTYHIFRADIHVYGRVTGSDGSVLGYTRGLASCTPLAGCTDVAINQGRVTRTNIYIFKNVLSSSAQAANLNVLDCIKMTMAHEFGHALGLLHPADRRIDSIMKQGLLTNYSIREYDKNELIKREGR